VNRPRDGRPSGLSIAASLPSDVARVDGESDSAVLRATASMARTTDNIILHDLSSVLMIFPVC